MARISEFSEAKRVWGGNLGLHVIQFPTGKWGFAGSVPAVLAYRRKDGQPLTEDDARNVRQFGAGLFKATIESCVWASREDAVAAANAIGAEVR